MEDNYFDKKIKGILESSPEFQPDQSALTDMQARLRTIPRPKKKRRGLFFLIPLLLLPVLLGAGFFYKKYDDLKNQVTELNFKISEINQTLRRDTIIEKQIIHHYDTIHTTVYREKYIKEKQPNKNNFYQIGFQPPLYTSNQLNTSPFYTPNILGWSIGNSKNSLFTKNPGSSIFDDDSSIKNGKSSSGNRLSATDRLESLFPIFVKIADRMEPDWILNMKDQLPEYKKQKPKPQHYFIPKGFTFGINYSPYVFPFNVFGSQGNAFGVTGAIEFPGGRSLEIGGTLLNTNFKIKEDPDLYALLPIVDPTDPADFLHEIKGNFRYLEIPVILRQQFRENHDLKPFVSAGFVAYKPFSQEFIYEYLNGFGEYKLNETFKNGTLSVDNLRFGLGAEYALGKHVSAASELQYQHSFSLNANEYFKLRYFALNIGLRYKM